ncbi:MAG: hypothetical protein AAF773_25970, partial [Cyanobacteria bacterium P01_D01_bin.115]
WTVTTTPPTAMVIDSDYSAPMDFSVSWKPINSSARAWLRFDIRCHGTAQGDCLTTGFQAIAASPIGQAIEAVKDDP